MHTPCEAELLYEFGRKPKCDENGDYYPGKAQSKENLAYQEVPKN